MPFRSRRTQRPNTVAAYSPAPAAGGGYTAQGVRFNGSTYLNAPSLTGMADGQKGIISFWFKFVGGDSSYQLLMETRDQQSIVLYRDNTGHWSFQLMQAGAISALNFTSSTAYTSSMTQWVHFLSSWDLGAAGTATFYVNDVSGGTPSFSGGVTINYLASDTNIDFAARSGGAIPLNCDIADFYFNTTQYLDFNTTSNRRKFISSTGTPVDLGATGSTPTGTAPIIFLHGSVASWHTNDGTGGGFNITSGSLSASATNP